MDDNNRESFWRRLFHKRRFSILDENTLTEQWYIRLSGIGAFTLVMLLFLLTIGLLSVLVLYTPIRTVLPGYSENIRQQLVEQTSRVDSLQNSLDLQKNYLEVIKQVVAGEVSSDTVTTLDSMQIVMREQLLQAKNEATEEFMAQYEQKEKDNLQLFDVQQTTPSVMLFRPAHGVVAEHFAPKDGRFGITIQTPDNENITSILSGTLVFVQYNTDETFTLVVHHASYLSVYRHVGRVLKRVGDNVQAGESIAIAAKDKPLGFELWQSGSAVNPEEVIVF